MKRFAGTILFLALLCPALSGQREIDSLKKLLNAAGNPAVKMELFGLVGEQFYLESPDSTLYYTQLGLNYSATVAQSERDSAFYLNQSMLYNNAAFINNRKGKLYEAILLYEKAIAANLKVGETNSLGGAYLNLGTLYRDIGENDVALNYLNKAKKVLLSSDYIAAGNCQMTIGTINLSKGDDEAALNNFFSAIGLFQKEYSAVGMSRANDYIGEVYFKRRDYEQALHYYQLSFEKYAEAHDSKGLAEVHFHLARLYRKINEPEKALENGKLSMEYAQQLGYPKAIRDAASILYELYRDEKQYDEALKMHELFKTMSDTLQADDAIKAGVQERLKSDYENKEALLRADQEKNREALKRQKLISYASLGGGILLLTLLLFAVRSYRIKRKANIEISAQKELVQEKNKEILDSINYANRIQRTLLANDEFLNENLPEHFIYFRPKDIVSGDFYWAGKNNSGKLYLAICDSTGHGVPGAFMSLLNISFLNEAISEKKIEMPDQILNHVRERLISNISKEGAQDGMDGVLLYFDPQSPAGIAYAAANNSPIIIRNKKAITLDADKMPVGKSYGTNQSFTLYREQLQPGDLLIVYTDGFADQFGGSKSKKYKYRRLNELIASNADKTLNEIRSVLEKEFDEWKGENFQVDDVLVFGMRL